MGVGCSATTATISTARTNIGLQYEPFATRIAAVHFGLESPRLA